ncbi:MAG: ATP-binding protein [Elainellaceae cyanobacterium]
MQLHPQPSPSSDTISLLLVEDSASDISLVRRMLERSRLDYEVKGATRLSEAIALAQQQQFDVALLDLTLPDSDGLATVESFLSAPVNLPTIVLTVLDDEGLALQSITQGAQDYLIKDEISPEMLTRSIRYSIERGRLMGQIQEANQELEAFGYSAAHDLRAPLRAIMGFSDVLLTDDDDEDITVSEAAVDYIRHIQTSALRMSQLINDLLAYSRIRTDSISLEVVDLNASVSNALAQLQGDIDRTQARITVDSPLPKVMGSNALVVQAIANLVSNAVKFVEPGTQPHICIKAKQRDASGQHYVRLWVIDNGIGIAPRHREQIFQVFKRLNGPSEYPGSGLGLAIVQKAIYRAGGVIGVDSTPGQGSQFWFELPKA